MHKYLVLTTIGDQSLDWAEALQQSTAICHTFRRAYDIGLFLAKVAEPDLNYRKAMAVLKEQGAVTVRQRDGEQAATIFKAKVYS